jgi:monoamine oxidase
MRQLVFCLYFPLTSCFHWGSRASHLLPDETALDKSYDYDGEVIIVGAGASGLAAARVLEQNDVSYTILEATEHYGGRLQEDTEFADFPIDLGAEWIHNNAEILDVLSGEEGTAANMDLIPYHLEEVYRWDGNKYKELPSYQANFMFGFFPEYKFQNTTWFRFIGEHYGERVAHRIQYNTIVTEVDYSRDKIQLKTQDGGVFRADKVLVTTSIGILKSGAIGFVPPLSKSKRDAIDSVDYLPGIKLILKFTKTFYPDVISCPVDNGEKTFYDVAFKKGSQDHILGLLATGSATGPYGTLISEEELVEAALHELDTIFDGEATESFTGDFIVRDWGRHAFTQGTWVEGFGISKKTLAELNAPLGRKVYFAGEANDVYHQLGVPGAVLSGLHAVDRLLSNTE